MLQRAVVSPEPPKEDRRVDHTGMRRSARLTVASVILLIPLTVGAAGPDPIDVELWPQPLILGLPVSGRGGYGDLDNDPFLSGEYRFTVDDLPGTVHTLPTTLVLNADGGACGDGHHTPTDSAGVRYTDGVWEDAFHFSGGHLLLYSAGILIEPHDGGVDFWFRLHLDITDPVYNDYNVLFWLSTSTGDHIYVETQQQRIIGTSHSGGGYSGAWPPIVPLHAGDWHHFAYGWRASDSTAALWLDGAPLVSSSQWRGVTGSAELVSFGSTPWADRAALADLDAIRLWRRLPTDDEMVWASLTPVPPSQCSALIDGSGLEPGTAVRFSVRVADTTGVWSDWASSVTDTMRPALIESIAPPKRLVAHDAWSLPLRVVTSVPCECRASEESSMFSAMAEVLPSNDGFVHTAPWPVDPSDAYHEIAVRCSSFTGDIDPDLVPASTGYRRLLPYAPPFPRNALLWGGYDPGLGPSFYSRYDLIITGEGAGFTAELQPVLRALNTDLKVLTTGYISYGGEPMSEWSAINNPDDPHYNWVLRDPQGDVIEESYWGHPFYNLTDSSCVCWLVEYNVSNWKDTDLAYDGIYFDRIHDWISFISDEIDADQDGIADDPVVLDSLWSAGMEYYLQLLREALPNEVVCGNDTPLHFGPYIHGRLFEMGVAQVMDVGADWDNLVGEYIEWENVHREPYLAPVVCSQAPLEFLWEYGLAPWNSVPPDSIEWVRTQYQRVRFGLGTALMSEGLYVYDFGTTWWGHPWWYDEYDVVLGHPTSDRYRIVGAGTTVALDGFEDGTAGSYNLWNWGSMWSEITDDSAEVVSGVYSLKGGNNDPAQVWNEFAHSDLNAIPLESDSSYTVTFTYKILAEPLPEGYFYFFARSLTGGVPSDVGHRTWGGSPGHTDSVTTTFTLQSYNDYYLVFGLKYTGEYAVDDIRVLRGGGGLWRRDFDHGAAVVNPWGTPQTVDLGDTLYRFLGVQDPVHNDGEMVTALTLAGYDAVLLVEHAQNPTPPPVRLSISADGTDGVLHWTQCTGAAGYHVYRDTSAYFGLSGENRLTAYPIHQLYYVDSQALGDPAVSWYYLVTAVGPTGVESAPSNTVGERDFETLADLPRQARRRKAPTRAAARNRAYFRVIRSRDSPGGQPPGSPLSHGRHTAAVAVPNSE